MTTSPAQIAAQRDKARQAFIVYADTGQTVVCYSRSLAVELAWKLNGSWARIPRQS